MMRTTARTAVLNSKERCFNGDGPTSILLVSFFSVHDASQENIYMQLYILITLVPI
jgi:hypothetical protein